MAFDQLLVVYLAPLAIIWAALLWRRRRRERRSRSVLSAASESAHAAPSSLHPKIDPARCLGCGACTRACPEGDVLGLVDGRAALLAPSECIGHGACRSACPLGAITLVYGTETRGVDIPNVGSDFQTNVPGVYIAGELGGMGLIRNAIEQGRQAMDAIARRGHAGRRDCLDVVIVGGGPAGISASLGAIEHGLRFVTLEQESFGGTVAHFPRGKLVMTAPATLPIVGRVRFREISKEKLLAFWREVTDRTGLAIRYGERLDGVRRSGDALLVDTNRGSYQTRALLLAIGRRGTPRRLGVPGEDSDKVVYRLVDPAQYRDRHVLVVGGGDSAIEAACSIAEEPGAVVTLSYRGAELGRAKARNRQRLESAVGRRRVRLALSSTVASIASDTVELAFGGRRTALRNDAVIVCAGGVLPTALLASIGIAMETKYGTV